LTHRFGPRQITWKDYLLPVTLILLAALASLFLVGEAIRGFAYRRARDESYRLATGYAQSLSRSAEATELIDALLVEKLTAAGSMVLNSVPQDTGICDEFLARLANSLQVDQIFYYNAAGEIICTNELYKGWKALPGHPVYDFMQSGATQHVEEIRRDTESDTYYKYAYFQHEDGGFVQVGVRAETVQQFLGHFEVEYLLKEMAQTDFIHCISFLNNDMQLVASSSHPGISDEWLSDEAKAAILADQEYAERTVHDGEHVYQVLLPISVEGQKIGTLSMTYSLASASQMIHRVNLVASGILAGGAIIALGVVHLNYQKDRELVYRSYFDPVTGLPNQLQLAEFVDAARRERERGQKKRAILLVDNQALRLSQTFSLQYGNDLARHCSTSLCQSVGQCHPLFYLGLGRFLILVESYQHQADLVSIADQILSCANGPMPAVNANVGIGVVEFNGESQRDADQLIRQAAIAADAARQSQSGYRFFDRAMEESFLRQELIEQKLQEILSGQGDSRLYLVYQPIVELHSNRIVALEALARVHSDELGAISPLEFIPIAERTRLIIPLGQEILRLACRFLHRLEADYGGCLKVSVNISIAQLLVDGFVTDLLQIVEETGVNPHNLVIEITESLMLDEYGPINQRLRELTEQGIHVVIDDYGTGYSSYARIGNLHVNGIKIDKAFVDSVLTSEPDQLLLGDITAMAHRLGKYVVAEGVEVEQQLQYLRQHHCNYMQGYLLSRPLPESEVLALVNSHNRPAG
jgi:EAL domain-containing protein (putative c-di-GMP-specific phosphodiesterase class I)/GGDEF domain-containing protein